MLRYQSDGIDGIKEAKKNLHYSKSLQQSLLSLNGTAFLIGLAAVFRSGATVMFDKANIQSYREANLTAKKERYSIA